MPKLKTLFETPKKAAVTVACILVMLATLGVASAYAANAFAQSAAIGAEEAAGFAFADAGVDPASAEGLHVELDREYGRSVYEVEFLVGDAKYEYHIDAADGSVVKKEKKVLNTAQGGTTFSKTLEEARAIALADAGVNAGGAAFTEEKLDQDNGLWVYEFEFRAGDTRYEYEINANTGAVYSKVTETYVVPAPAPTATPEPTAAPAPESTPRPTPAPTQTPISQPSASQAPASAAPSYTHHPEPSHHPETTHHPEPTHHQDSHHSGIAAQPAAGVGLEGAKAAALADAGLSVSSVTFTKAAPDYEDGVPVYEIEFYTSTHEYEYEIAAATGAVYSRSVEAFQVSLPTPAPNTVPSGGSAYIGAEQAQSIALNHAGLSASQVTVTKAALDRDDGRMVYEIEFRLGQVEYEYEIDAVSGSILEYDVDRD